MASISKVRANIFGYLDETGLLTTPSTDRVFGLVVPNPRELHTAIIRYKDRAGYHQEFKSTDIRQGNLRLYTGLIDLIFSCQNVRFSCAVYDKRLLDVAKHFNGDNYRAYNAFAAKLISESLDKGPANVSEYITLLADDVSTPKNDKFDKVVRDKIKMRTRRNALFGMARLESHAVSEIQACDVLLGLVAYSFKVKYGLVPGNGVKLKAVKHLQSKLNVPALSESFERRMKKGAQFRVLEFERKNADDALGPMIN
jgi:hypothetical protein